MRVLFIPSIGLPDSIPLLNRLADSVDHDVKWKVVLNNGITGALESFKEAHPDWIVKEPVTQNRGVSGSWNDCAKWFSSEPNWLIANEDCFFIPGYLQKICECMDANRDAPIVYLNDSCPFYCFGWSLAGREMVGEFDENLFPAYMEDCDYRVRMRLLGITEHPYALQGLPPLPHGKPRSGGVNYSAMIQGTGLLNRAYWRKKWGSDNYEQATYQTPYRDHRLTPREWVWMPEHRSQLWPIWNAFITQPDPSIYT